MEVRVLGSSGGVGTGKGTTSLLVDNDILIDAGTGVAQLSIDELSRLRHIFLTHSHLDHVAYLPLLGDTVFGLVSETIRVYALSETLDALQRHIFNDVIWPDFTRIPNRQQPVFRFQSVDTGETVELGTRRIEAIAVNHTVPCIGFRVACGEKAFAISGDTTCNDGFWEALNAHPGLDLLLVETAFSDKDEALSRLARHYSPRLLAADLQKLRHRPPIYIIHAKPGEESAILRECREALADREVYGLAGGAHFTL